MQDFNDQLQEEGPDGVRASVNDAAPHTLEPPLPLIRDLPPAPPFPIAALSPRIQNAALSIHAATQAPMDICANAVLAAACLATQPLADVRLPTGEVKPLSLYFVTVAKSGERKTSVDNLALAAIKAREEELRREYGAEHASFENSTAAWEQERAKIKANKKLDYAQRKAAMEELGAEPIGPILPVSLCPEPTFEGLIRLLAHGQPSVGVFTSEGGVFVGGHGFTDEAKLRTGSGLSLLWDDGSMTRVRAGDGVIALVGRRVAMHLQVQPGVAARLLGDRVLLDQGLLSRVLISAPESSQGTRFWKEPLPLDRRGVEQFQAHTGELLRRPLPLKAGTRNELTPPVLAFSPAARATWIAFSDHVEAQLGPNGELNEISGFANKMAEQAARIAAVLTKFEDPDATEIDELMVSRGIMLAQHYGHAALRLHGASRAVWDLQEAKRLLEWLHQKWTEPSDQYGRSSAMAPTRCEIAGALASSSTSWSSIAGSSLSQMSQLSPGSALARPGKS